jgi:hypothetical protein
MNTTPATRDDLDAVRREAVFDSSMTDEALDDLMFRVIQLEEVLAARWPRSILVRGRLARAIRRSVREIDGSDFTGKRLNVIGTGWRDRVPSWDTRRAAYVAGRGISGPRA